MTSTEEQENSMIVDTSRDFSAVCSSIIERLNSTIEKFKDAMSLDSSQASFILNDLEQGQGLPGPTPLDPNENVVITSPNSSPTGYLLHFSPPPRYKDLSIQELAKQFDGSITHKYYDVEAAQFATYVEPAKYTFGC